MRFELMIDLQTAKSLGLVVTASIMLRADEVIECGAALLRLLTAAFGTKRTCPLSSVDVRFSNRPFRVKRFQTIHHYSVDVAHGLVLLFGIGTRGPSIMGFEDEAERSFGRPCRQTNGRSKRTCELTSSIVPRGTSFHRSVETRVSLWD